MSKKSNGSNRKIVLFSVIAVLLVAVAAIIISVSIVKKNEQKELRNEKLDELVRRQGEYDQHSIVLTNINSVTAGRLAKRSGATLRMSSNGKFATLTLPSDKSIIDVFSDDSYLKDINKMSADWMVYVAEGENDPVIDEDNEITIDNLQKAPRFEVSDTLYSSQTYLNYLNLEDVWEYTRGSVKIAIIDTGIDYTHPEFEGKISEYSYDCSNDKVVRDYDYSIIYDRFGHGTRVAGVIAAAMDGAGTVGIASDAELLIIRADSSPEGIFTRMSDLVFGIYYAIEQDVDIINMSFAVNSSGDPFKDAIQLAVDSDIICIAAAGNNGSCNTFYPASNPYVIGVGAMDETCSELWEMSNFGDNVDVVAPGSVYTTDIEGGYCNVSGTSMAAATVTGATALYLSLNRYVEVKDFREVLFASCTDLGAKGKDFTYGYGLTDIAALVIKEKGTVTFDYLTDELNNTKQVFVRNKTLQDIPFPDRNYAVFEGWYYDDQMTEKYNLYEDVFVGDLTLYANWINEDDGVPFIYVILDDDTVEIRGYTGHRRFITVPDYIEGMPVSSIGDNAFNGESEFREVTLPKYLVNIGFNAFYNCTNLVKIDIPDSVKYIGSSAFTNNQRLSAVNFGEDSLLETIGGFAFSNCGRIKTFDLGQHVSSVNATAFYADTRLTDIIADARNASFKSVDGVLYNKQETALVAFPAGHGTSFTIPGSVVKICGSAFAYAGITSIDLTNVTDIGGSAFAFSKLISVVIPDTVTSLGGGAFKSNLQLSSVTLGRGIDVIGNQTFYGDRELSFIEIPETITVIGSEAFRFSGLEEVVFTSAIGLEEIENYAFACTPLRSIEIPGTVEKIGGWAFSFDKALTNVEFQPYGALMMIGDNAFTDAFSLQSIELPNNLLMIMDEAFFHTGLQGDITVPESVVNIGFGVFSASPISNINMVDNDCYKSVNGVLFTSDGKELIAYPCGNSRTSYTVPDGTEIITRKAFCAAENLLTVVLPDSLTTISIQAFNSMHRLNEITIPKNVKTIGAYAFSFTERLHTIDFAEDTTISRLGLASFAYSGLRSFTVPASVSTMGQEVFTGSDRLETVEYAAGSNLRYMAAYTFKGCSSIRSIVFGENSALIGIEAHALEGLSNLETLDLSGTGVTKVGNFGFRFCEKLSDLRLPDGLLSIGRYAFYDCGSLEELSIPETVEFIGRFAFLGTDKVDLYFKSETLPETLQEDWDYGTGGYYLGVQSVDENDTWKYATLTSGGIAILSYKGDATSVSFDDPAFAGDVVNIGGYAFAYSNVEHVDIPETVQTIQNFAFFNSKLESLSVPASVSFIGKKAFAFTPIETLTFNTGSQLKTIEQSAFEGTTNLAGVSIPSSVTTLGRAVFKNSGISGLAFEPGIAITEIPKEAFAKTKITALIIPDSVEVVWDNAFRETRQLETVSFGAYPDLKIRANAFYDSGLRTFVIPENVTYIGEFAFVSLQDLAAFEVAEDNPYYKSVNGMLLSKDGRKLISAPGNVEGAVTVPEGVEVIGFGAFENSKYSEIYFPENANILTFGYRAFFGMNNLTSIAVPVSVVSIDYYAFAYCEQLRSVTFAPDCLIKGIYEGAFCGDYRLADITIPDSVVEISDFAFYGCEAITSIPITNACNLKGIYSYAMAYTGLMDELDIPESVIDIGDYAFLCTNITSLNIPSTNAELLMIGIGAFEDCNNLERVSLPFIGASLYGEDDSWFAYIFGAGDYKNGNYYIPASLKLIEFQDGCETVGPNAFRELESTAKLILPRTISELGEGAFYECKMSFEINSIVSFRKVDERGIYSPDKAPGMDYFFRSGITKVDFSDSDVCGFDAIGIGLFLYCEDLTSAELPYGITRIDSSAFEFCYKLENVNIPESVVEIGSYAFGYCESLKKITIPDSVETIAASFGYSGIEELYIGHGVKEIPESAFELVWSLKKVTLTNVEVIGKNAFHICINLDDLSLGDSLRVVEEGAFDFCGTFKRIVLPESLESIGENAFASTFEVIVNNSSLDLNFDDSYGKIAANASMIIERDGTVKRRDSEGISLTTPDKLVFEVEGDDYTLIAYAGDEDTVTLPVTIEGHPYSIKNLWGVKNVIVPEGITEIGEQAFEYNKLLESVQLPSSVSKIGQCAFNDCEQLRSIIIPDGIETIEYRTFADCKSLEAVILPDSVTVIGEGAFWGCGSLNSIDLPSNLTRIGFRAFQDCSSLEEIIIPDSVSVIDWSAFYNCSSLSNVKLSESLEAIYNLAFFETAVERVIIPDSCSYIGGEAFGYCRNLRWINIPQNVWALSGNTFAGCDKLEAVMIDQVNEDLIVCDGIIYNKEMTELVMILPDCRPDIVLPDTLRSVSEGAFSGNSRIESIVIPATETEIQGLSFHDCSNLKNVVLPEGMVNIPQFISCHSLENITIPESARYFGGFTNCTSLKSVYIPEGVVEFPSVRDCSSLVSLELPSTIRSFRDSFDHCEALESIVIPEGVTELPTFWSCYSLQHIEIPSTITSIPNGAFCDCYSLTSFDWPNNIDTIPNGVFDGCSSMTSFSIPENVHTIGDQAFAKSGIVSMIIPDTVSVIGINVFGDCKNLETVIMPSYVDSIGDRMFSGCPKLSYVKLPDNINSIPLRSFVDCYSLKSITIPESVAVIETEAFTHSGLVSVKLPEHLSVIEDGAFSSCENMSSIDIPSCISIGQYAFGFCGSLIKITIPEGVTTIENGTFNWCDNLTIVEIPESVTSIGEYAFQECRSLIIAQFGDYVQVAENAFDGCPSYIGLDENIESIITDDGFLFLKYDGRWELRAYLGDDYEVTLPETAPDGTAYSLWHVIGIRKVIIPGSFIMVSWDAFSNNQLLEEAIISEGIEIIGSGAFSGCSALANVSLPSTLREIEGNAFDGASSLKHINIPDSVDTIGYYAFSCTGLEDFSFPPNIKSVCIGMFNGCRSLRDFVVPEGIEEIGDQAFWYCDSMNNISLPSTLKTVHSGAFACSGVYNNEANWTDDYLIIDGWICEIKAKRSYFDIPDNFRGIAYGAYANATHIKFAYNSCQDLYNAESVLITAPRIENIKPIVQVIPETLKNIIISADSRITSSDAFKDVTGITIFVEAAEKDCRWDENYPGWNNENRVIYGDDWSYSNFYGVNGELVYKAPRPHSKVVLRPYYRLNRNLMYEYNTAWDLDGDNVADIVPATSVDDINAHAIITERTLRKYAVRYYDYDGTLLYEQEVNYGDPVPPFADPSRESTESLDYAFYRWVVTEGNIADDVDTGYEYIDTDPDGPNRFVEGDLSFKRVKTADSLTAVGNRELGEVVNGALDFTAEYIHTFSGYTITFCNWDGTIISQDTYHYWDTVNIPDDPERASDLCHAYTFTGWDKAISKVTEDTVYTAEYGETELDMEVAFNHSCTFTNDLTLNYYIKRVDLAEYDEFYLVVEKDCYENGVLLPERKTTVLRGEDATLSGVNYYKFKYKGVASYELGDNCYAVLHAFKDGAEYVSSVDEYSLKTYAYNRLQKSTDAEFKTLLVDLLNYCSQSQVYFGYRTGELVNADLTDAQRALASATYAELISDEDKEVLEDATVTYYGKTVVFGSNIEVKVYVKLNNFTGNRDDLVMRFEYTDMYDSYTFEDSDFVYRSDYGAYSAKLIDIPMYDARTPIRITVLENDVPVSDTITYSIETYAKNRLEKSGDEVFKELLRMTMKYADSANLYFEHHH